MKTLTFALASVALILSACDNAKPRPAATSEAPQPAAPASAAAGAGPSAALSTGLAKRDEFPGFYLDHVGQAADPLNKQPATTAAGPILLDGFGFDPVAKVPAKGVDVVIDGKAYGTTYGSGRDDVAKFYKNSGLSPVGFTTTLPAGTLAAGPHVAQVRVIAADGAGYFESPKIAFSVN